ncbi:MAG: winged helix-turn-helix transcriptional regulator [Promethearchaeota archaeon]
MIPKLQQSVILGINREFQKHKQKEKIIRMDRSFIREASRLIQGKWTIDILFMIFFQENPYFNELRKSLPEINTRTLTSRLEQLKDKGIIERNVHVGKPVRVSYKMTSFGKGLTYLMFPTMIYIILEQDRDELKAK